MANPLVIALMVIAGVSLLVNAIWIVVMIARWLSLTSYYRQAAATMADFLDILKTGARIGRFPGRTAAVQRRKTFGPATELAPGILLLDLRQCSNPLGPGILERPGLFGVTSWRNVVTTGTSAKTCAVKESDAGLRDGLPNHLIYLELPDRYDWSFAHEAMAEIRRLGITPILDLMHFGVPIGSAISKTPRCRFTSRPTPVP